MTLCVRTVSNPLQIVTVQERLHCYSESGRSVPCKFEDYLKIDLHNWMTIRILLSFLLTSHSNVASVGLTIGLTIGVPFLGKHNE